MHRFSVGFGVLGIVLVINSLLARKTSAGVLVDFNSGSTDSYNANFTHSARDSSHGDFLTYGSTAGIDDQPGGAAGGGVIAPSPFSPPPDSTAVYAPGGTPVTFDINDGKVHTISMYIREGPGDVSGVNNRQLQLGFLTPADSNFNGGNHFISARLLSGNEVEFQSDNGGSTAAESVTTNPITGVQPNDWLQLIFTTQQTSPGVYAGRLSLLDYGPTGEGTPVTLLAPLSYTGQSNATDLTKLEGTALVAGFRVADDALSTTATLSYDNFAVDVPEPASIGMAGLGALALLGRRRKASTAGGQTIIGR